MAGVAQLLDLGLSANLHRSGRPKAPERWGFQQLHVTSDEKERFTQKYADMLLANIAKLDSVAEAALHGHISECKEELIALKLYRKAWYKPSGRGNLSSLQFSTIRELPMGAVIRENGRMSLVGGRTTTPSHLKFELENADEAEAMEDRREQRRMEEQMIAAEEGRQERRRQLRNIKAGPRQLESANRSEGRERIRYEEEKASRKSEMSSKPSYAKEEMEMIDLMEELMQRWELI